MSKLIVRGGKALRGTVTPIPNKNALLAALPAALLSSKEVIYRNVPDTSDLRKLFVIMEELGAVIKRKKTTVTIKTPEILTSKIDEKKGGEFRGSLLLVGGLLARTGEAWAPIPGGCDLGMRSIEAHVSIFSKLGVSVKRIGNYAVFKAPAKVKKDYQVWQIEASVSATENAAIYLAGTRNKAVIEDAAAEPHVSDLLNLLSRMGAKIDGIGSNRIFIEGGEMGGAEFNAGPDFVDIAGFVVAAGVTKGKILIKGANKWEVVGGMRNWFELFGIKFVEKGKDLLVDGSGGLRFDLKKGGLPLAADGLPKLSPRPWPGFPVDVIPVMATLACKTKGRLLLQNWMYESGLEFVRELNFMGADIFVADPQRIIINGGIKFRGGEITPPSVIQSVKACFLAALADDSTTIINGAEILQRRYPNIQRVYKKLGARVELK